MKSRESKEKDALAFLVFAHFVFTLFHCSYMNMQFFPWEKKKRKKKNYFLLSKNMEMKEMPTPKKAKKKYH